MPAYDMQRSEQLARLQTLPPQAARRTIREPATTKPVGSTGVHPEMEPESIIDMLLDRLADRVVDAVVARLGTDPEVPDQWLDSHQAAKYLGLHRDTLRRLAAARAIPAEQDGRGCKLFFRRAALDEWRRAGGRARHLAAVADAA